MLSARSLLCVLKKMRQLSLTDVHVEGLQRPFVPTVLYNPQGSFPFSVNLHAQTMLYLHYKRNPSPGVISIIYTDDFFMFC